MGSILNPLYTAVSWVIINIHNLLSPIFGSASGVTWSLSIIGLVIIIRIILIPLFVKANDYQSPKKVAKGLAQLAQQNQLPHIVLHKHQ